MTPDNQIVDFRLKVFYTVAQKLSFTKAAAELFITQPAVTRHIRELEQKLGVGLFKRNGNTISLTGEGEILLRCTLKILDLYAALENELAEAKHTTAGIIRVGASTTLAQTLLPRILAMFRQKYPAVKFNFIRGNTDFITQQLIQEVIDIGVVEGRRNHPQVNYEPFIEDEIVLVTRSGGPLSKFTEITPKQLTEVNLVMREQGSGTLDVIFKALSAAGINPRDLNREIELESNVSIKQYLLHSDSAAFLSIHSVAKELADGELTVIDIKGISIQRTFHFVRLHGKQSHLTDVFRRFCQTHYNIK